MILIILAESCSSPRPGSNENIDRLDSLLSVSHLNGNFDGTVLVADSSGILYLKSFGYADRENEIQFSMLSKFYLASVSKQFTATAIMKLWQMGYLEPSDKLIEHMPELPSLFENITIDNLLIHASGIPDYYNFSSIHPGFTNEDVLSIINRLTKLEFEPGQAFQYSNTGYVLLSILIERISGMSFSEFAETYLLQPASMENTIIFDESQGPIADRVTGYSTDGTMTDYAYRTTGGGGIYSSAHDLYLWDRAMYAENILPDSLKRELYKPRIKSESKNHFYAYGWFIDDTDSNHVYHSGDLEGFRTYFDRQLDARQCIVLLANNSPENLSSMAAGIRKILKTTYDE